MENNMNFPPIQRSLPPPPPKGGELIADEETKKLIEQEGYIITQHKYEGGLKGKEITVYNAKVTLKSREGIPVIFNLEGGTGLSREDMIKLIKLVQSYASHISVKEMNMLISGKTFGLNLNISGAEGKIGLLAWDPSKKQMLHVAATSQWYGSAPGMTLHSRKEDEKFYYFVFDVNDLVPLLPEEELDLKTRLFRGAHEILKGVTGGGMGNMLPALPGVQTQKDRIERMNSAWKKIHSKDSAEQKKFEQAWMERTKEEVHLAVSDVTPLQKLESSEDLKKEIGKRTLEFQAKRDLLKNMREAQAPTLSQTLFVPNTLGPQRTEGLKKRGASAEQWKVNSDLHILQQQIRALQMQLAAKELQDGKGGGLYNFVQDHYSDLPLELKRAGELHQKLIKQAQKLENQPQNHDELKHIYRKLELLEKVERQKILFVELALNPQTDGAKNLFEGKKTAASRLEALNEIQNEIEEDINLNFTELEKKLDDNRVQPLEMHYGVVGAIEKREGSAMGSFEKLLGISTPELLKAYKVKTPPEEIVIEREEDDMLEFED